MILQNPFAILGVPEDADDAAIRTAYLAAVQRHPPDRDAAGFQRVRAAYEVLKDKDDRLKLKLFGRASTTKTPPSEWFRSDVPRVFTGPGPWLKAIRRLAPAASEKKA